MIEKMRKYSFVLFHSDYESFLADLQRLGVVHIIRSTDARTDSQVRQLELMGRYNDALKLLKKIGSDKEKGNTSLPTKALLNRIEQAVSEKDDLRRQEDILKKQIRELSPWGHFDYELETQLENAGVKVDFHTCLKNHFKPEWLEQHCIRQINELGGIVYFVVLYTGEKPALDCDTFSFHKHTLREFETQLEELQQRIADIDLFLNETAPEAIQRFEDEIRRISGEYDYEDATLQASSEAEDHLRVLGGWIPVSKERELSTYLNDKGIIHFAQDGKADDNPPIQLRNNWFSRLFEPIGNMYMLPYYNEFDLTPFFAPFFMLFFGFCNADIAYGLVFIALGLFLRHKAKNPAAKSVMMLIVIFGISSMLMGWLMGSALAFDLKKTVLDPAIIIRNNDQIFNFALLLGAIQILFGVAINAVKKGRQSGFMHSVAPIGIFLFLGSLSVLGAEMLGTDISAVKAYVRFPMFAGLALLLLFNQPGKNPIINVLGGLWLLYNVITGFFGDILSYIRLFALGVSSAILGFVINSIGSQMLGIPIIGPVIFFVFMLLGHTLNIALGALSGFVHPMRLTFVEFFKNADFQGPGIQYKPFGNKQ
ncbi:MAG TPA: V-type ATPase 116kDa subunit family protein [Candidatus Cloacimonadota bacterium]|nr:V-type ATPase 116kDa subunit family protein [Candidatus Cloacimonadota bacterium]